MQGFLLLFFGCLLRIFLIDSFVDIIIHSHLFIARQEGFR